MYLVKLKMQIPVTLKMDDFFAWTAKGYGYKTRMKGEKKLTRNTTGKFNTITFDSYVDCLCGKITELE